MRLSFFIFRFAFCTVLYLASCVLRLTYAQTYDTIGKASYYAKEFNGRKTANGEIFSNSKFTCAHLTLPFGTKLKVTNLNNDKWCVVTVNDRGPYVKGRIIDLSNVAAKELDYLHYGLTNVHVQEITDENECRLIHNHDTVVVKKFPNDWQGTWCGTLEAFNAKNKTLQVPMKLIVHTTSDSLRWQWTIVYDTSAHNYDLVKKDDLYSIDERNGIILPATLMGNTMVSSFEVQGNRINAMYTLENDKIKFTILSVTNNTFVQTGLGTDDSPQVNSFTPNAYQSAILRRRD